MRGGPRTTSAGDTRTRRILTTVGAAALLVGVLVALSHQYAKTYALAREQARLEQRRRDLIADNAHLREEIERLRTDDRYLEEIARRQLGLVRPGEIELLVVPYDGTVSPPGAGPGGAPDRIAPAVPHADPAAEGSTEAGVRPRRGLSQWATGVRDAVWRLLRLLANR